jgi:hypothetical protein
MPDLLLPIIIIIIIIIVGGGGNSSADQTGSEHLVDKCGCYPYVVVNIDMLYAHAYQIIFLCKKCMYLIVIKYRNMMSRW